VYRKSARGLPAQPGIEYGSDMLLRKVSTAWIISWGHRIKIFLSGALAGWPVGLRHADADHVEVWFGHLLIGNLELSSVRFLRAASRPQEPDAARTA
jgi:hypothetical protein